MKTSKVIFLFIIISFSLITKPSDILKKNYMKNNVIFDMGGVLLKVSKFTCFRHLGFKTIFYRNIGNRFVDFITSLQPEFETPSLPRAKYLNKDLPPLMCLWQKGELSCEQFVNKIKDATENSKFFVSDTEKILVQRSAELLLPENHLNIQNIKPSGLKLLTEVKNKKDQQGNYINNVFIISNFDSETFDLLVNKFPEIFNQFDKEQIIVSGKVKMMKPHKDIFQHTIKKFQLDPKSCIFIDDQLENVEGAQSCGMNAIHHTRAKNTHKRLKALGVI